MNGALERGSRLNKKCLTSVITVLQNSAVSNPKLTVDTITDLLCDTDSKLASTTLLTSICTAISDIEPSFLLPIKQSLFQGLSSISVNLIYNTIHLLPCASLSPSEASDVLTKMISSLSQFQDNNSFFASLGHAVTKWAPNLTNRQIWLRSFLNVLSESHFTLSSLTLVCQCIVQLFRLEIGDATREVIENALSGNPCLLDEYTPKHELSFVQFMATIPVETQLRLATVAFESCSKLEIGDVDLRMRQLSPLLTIKVSSEVEISCLVMFIVMLLKLALDSKTPPEDTLKLCFDAMCNCPQSKDPANRKMCRSCVSSFLECSSKFASLKFAEYMFSVLTKSESLSYFKQDALPLLIPNVPFETITCNFFGSILSLLYQYQTFAIRCICRIYKTFEVPVEYTVMFAEFVNKLPPSTRLAVWDDLLAQSGLQKLQFIKHQIEHAENINESDKLSALLCIGSVEYKTTRKDAFTESMLSSVLRCRDADIRMSAVQYMCMKKVLSESECKMLSDAIPLLFVYGDLSNEQSQVVALEMVIKKLPEKEKEWFVRSLVEHFIPLLSPLESGLRKFYIIRCMKVVMKHSSVTLTSSDLEKLVDGMFESSQSLRNEMFTLVLPVMKKHEELIESAFVQQMIEKNKESERFRESEGAAMLVAMMSLVRNQNPILEMLDTIDLGKGMPQHFPLSVIFHYVEHCAKNELDMSVIVSRVLPLLCNLVTNSLKYIGMEADFEAQAKVSVRKSWHAVKQSLNIIMRCFKLYGETLPHATVESVGDTLFHFLMDSRHFSTVYRGHMTFREVCSCCLCRTDECCEYPMKWCRQLLSSGGLISSGDHRVSGSLVQTVGSLLDAEQSMNSRSIAKLLIETCLRLIQHPETDEQLMSALLVTEAILSDSQRQTAMKSYLPSFLMAILTASANSRDIEVKRSANKCFCTLILRQYLKRNELKRISSKEFFNGVEGIREFFIEQLRTGQQEIVFIILWVIEMMIPFHDQDLLVCIKNLRSSRISRIRKTSARALLIVLPPNEVNEFLQELLTDLRTKTEFNVLDGAVSAIISISKNWNCHIEDDIRVLSQSFHDSKSYTFERLWAIAKLCEYFGLFDALRIHFPVLLQNEHVLRNLPLGNELLGIVVSAGDPDSLVNVFRNGSAALVRRVALKCADLSQDTLSVVVDRYLSEKDQSVVDALGQLLLSHEFRVTPSQKEKFHALFLSVTDSTRLVELIKLADSFELEAKFVFSRFVSVSAFLEHPNDDVLPELSRYAMKHHDSLFQNFNGNLDAWKLALRLISDDNAGIRECISNGLIPHLTLDKNVCEFEILTTLYKAFSPAMLQELLDGIVANHVGNSDESHFRKEPPSFFFPPSLHIRIITGLLHNVQ